MCRRRFLRIAATLLVCLLAATCFVCVRAIAVETKNEPQASLEISAAAMQPAGMPVFLTVRLSNTGKVPFFYWSGRGSDSYPQGDKFKVSVIDSKKKDVQAEVYNGAYTQGSGANIDVLPGKTLEFPLTVSVLPSGVYELKLSSAAEVYTNAGKSVTSWPSMESTSSVKVTVRVDSELKKKSESDLLTRVSRGEFFATRVVNHYAIASVVNKLPELLSNDSAKEAFIAAQALSMAKEFPVGCGRFVSAAMSKNLKRNPTSYESTNLMVYLAEIAKRVGDDPSLEAVLNLAKEGPTVESRWHAVKALTKFKQPSAVAALKQFMHSKDTAVKGAAAVGLAERDDTSAIPILIDLAHVQDGYQSWNPIYRALARFPNDKSASAAIREGLKNSDESLRRDAEEAEKVLHQK